jgi:prevent-host-death family protein
LAFVLDRWAAQVKVGGMGTITYTEARERLASVWDEVVSSREAVVIRRRGHPDIAMLPADELSSLMETVHRGMRGISPRRSVRR